MIDLKQHVRISKNTATPVYLQISEHIIALIMKGVLPAGVRIQTTRDLSQQLGVHRKTIVAAYNELLAQGWLQSKVRKGMFVSNIFPTVKPIPLAPATPAYPDYTNFDVGYESEDLLLRKSGLHGYKFIFNDGFPDVRLAPLDSLLKEYHSLGRLKVSRRLLSYSSKEGSLNLRQALANDLRETRGMPVTAENILITKGAQMGIFMAASLLIKPGDAVIVGSPNYFLVNLMLTRLRAEVLPVPIDDQGIDVDLVEEMCKRRRVRMIYVIPHHHHPTTVTLSPERRLRLLALAQKQRIAIIEDDYDFDIHFQGEPVLPMASIDRSGNVIYVGTLSKILAPAIRIGFVVAPKSFISLLAQHRFMIDMQGDNLLEEATALLYNNGTIRRHLKKIRRVYKDRRDTACNLLQHKLGDHVSFKTPDGGMSLWIKFNGVSTQAVAQAAALNGLFICDGKKHNTADKDFNSICIGFASMNNNELEQALTLLARSVAKITRRQTQK
jgi:GntR family transcriptional regulator/MocR family aminotransferase